MDLIQPYPPAPWSLQGEALLRLQLVPVEAARQFVPEAVRLVSVLPKRTLAALYLARYQAGSTLQYHELIVVPALVQQGSKMGGWISHIYVDNEASLAGGRDIWALPKEMARFEWQSQGSQCEVKVTREGRTLCHMHTFSRGWGLKLPVVAPALSRRGDRLLSFRGVGSSHVSHGRGEVHVPGDSPFADLGFAHGRLLFLNRLNLKMDAPRR